MQIRQRASQVGIALVGTDDECPLVCQRKIDARHRRIGTKKFFAQMLACGTGQVMRIGTGDVGSEMFAENFGDALFFHMNRRQHDMAGRFMRQLHDPLAEVRIGHVDTQRLQMRIEPALFGQHRFAFDDMTRPVFTKQPRDDAIVFGGIGRPVHFDAVGFRLRFKTLQVPGKMRRRMGFDRLRGFAERFPFFDALRGTVTFFPYVPQCPIVPAGIVAVRGKRCGFGGMIGGSLHHTLPASSCATCTKRIGVASRRASPCICIRHDMSTPAMISTPAAR